MEFREAAWDREFCVRGSTGGLRAVHGRGSVAARARVDEALGEFGESDAELRPEAAFQAAIVLRAAEDIVSDRGKWRCDSGVAPCAW